MFAFSGVGSTIYKKFEDSFKFIQTRISHLPTTTIFIEPITKPSKLYLKFLNKIMDAIDWLRGKEESTGDNRFKWYDPIRKHIAPSGVSMKLYNRGKL